MPSGGKQLQINSQERAVSTDINRLQLFAGYDRAELARFGQDANQGSDDNGALFTQNLFLSGPASAVIEAGLLVTPGNGTLNLLVSPGALYAVVPDSDPDSSVYKLVTRDPGVFTTGVLTMTAGITATRIDIIECSLTQIISETSNRDIFNPVTGLFSAVTVTKAIEDRLVYRVRMGNPGTGWPGVISGWVPLAVASVPSTATANDQMIFWDVRPLAAGRLFPPYNLGKLLPQVLRADLFLDTHTTAGHAILTGEVEVEGASDVSTTPATPALYRLGGVIENPASFAGADVSLARYQSLALGTAVVYGYLCEPFGLPRWAEYSNVSGQIRSPRLKGIIALSNTAPFDGLTIPNGTITLPPTLGFASVTNRAACFLVTHATGNVIDAPTLSSNKTQYASGSGGGGPAPIFTPATMSQSTVGLVTTATFTLVSGTTHPPNAKALWMRIFVDMASSPGTWGDVYVTTVDSVGNVGWVGTMLVNGVAGSNALYGEAILRIPLGGNNLPRTVVLTSLASGWNIAVADVLGWDL
jgi:hypothetical protein